MGVPAILVPLPQAPNDHQRLNAQWLTNADLATIVEDKEFDGVRLVHEMTAMLKKFRVNGDPDIERRKRSIGPRDATQRVADLVVNHCPTVLPAD